MRPDKQRERLRKVNRMRDHIDKHNYIRWSRHRKTRLGRRLNTGTVWVADPEAELGFRTFNINIFGQVSTYGKEAKQRLAAKIVREGYEPADIYHPEDI